MGTLLIIFAVALILLGIQFGISFFTGYLSMKVIKKAIKEIKS